MSGRCSVKFYSGLVYFVCDTWGQAIYAENWELHDVHPCSAELTSGSSSESYTLSARPDEWNCTKKSSVSYHDDEILML